MLPEGAEPMWQSTRTVLRSCLMLILECALRRADIGGYCLLEAGTTGSGSAELSSTQMATGARCNGHLPQSLCNNGYSVIGWAVRWRWRWRRIWAVDSDNDGEPDNTDNCPSANAAQTDTDNDGTGDACDGRRQVAAVARSRTRPPLFNAGE